MSANLSTAAELPPAAPGFERIHRYRDALTGDVVAKIMPGEWYVTRHEEWITTVLGSCIAVCARNVATGIGGMNHFMLPGGDASTVTGHRPAFTRADTRYGAIATEALLREIARYGDDSSNLELKVFGGGRVLKLDLDVAAENINFARTYLRAIGASVTAWDVGGVRPRKLRYCPTTGVARVAKLDELEGDARGAARTGEDRRGAPPW